MQAADKGDPSLSSMATIRVQVVDVNDNSPAIPHMEPVVVAESMSDPAVLLTVDVQHLDCLTHLMCSVQLQTSQPVTGSPR